MDVILAHECLNKIEVYTLIELNKELNKIATLEWNLEKFARGQSRSAIAIAIGPAAVLASVAVSPSGVVCMNEYKCNCKRKREPSCRCVGLGVVQLTVHARVV